MTEQDHGPVADDLRLDYDGWLFWREATPEQQDHQRARQETLRERTGGTVDPTAFVSARAMVEPTRFSIGARSYIAAHSYVTGDITMGDDCTINVFSVVRGLVRFGDGVRVGAHTSILGFNHSMEPDRPVYRQPLTQVGVTIGDDVWIGSNVVVLDGVVVGSHAVLAAGAVVTKEVPEWAIIAGNPARVLRDRRVPKGESAAAVDHARDGVGERVGDRQGGGLAERVGDRRGVDGLAERVAGRRVDGLAERVAGFAARARSEADVIVDRSWEPQGIAPDGTAAGRWVDAPGAPATRRAHADAVEISMLLTRHAPRQLSDQEHIARLRFGQDADSGLTPEVDEEGRHPEAATSFEGGDEQYHVLSLGYALDLLGSRFDHPVQAVAALSPRDVLDFCETRPWHDHGWSAGAAIDSLGTALLWNLRGDVSGVGPGDDSGVGAGVGVGVGAGSGVGSGVGVSARAAARPALDALIGWMTSHASRTTGLWSEQRLSDGLLQPVNGFYRATRGTLAQFALPVAYPEKVIDSVFRQIGDARHFGPGRTTACNMLDVAHPLWLARRQTGHRRDEISAFARASLDELLDQWVAGAGFPFRFTAPAASPGLDQLPGFKGTEMWLATAWYLADLAGIAEALGYRPAGVHRPEPAFDLERGAATS